MFVKRSFGVKYPLEVRLTVTPPEHTHPMSALMVCDPIDPAHVVPLDHETYRRRRLVVLAIVAGIALGVTSFGRQAGANRTAEADAADAVIVVVEPGDTLWDIARSLSPDDDPRPLADALSDLAGGTTLQPGQRIVVPGSLVD